MAPAWQFGCTPVLTTGEPITFVDLFAGLGGFHVALEQLGATCVFAAEWEPDLQDLYERNFGLRPVGDLTKVDSDSIPAHTILCAGFPCQPFSKAGDQLGFEHTKQGQLFFKVLEILAARKPKCFILENVPNILNHNDGETLKTIKNRLARIGYAVDVKRYSPHEFGIPQIRDRAYFIGSLEGLDSYTWPATSRSKTDITSVLDRDATADRPIPAQTLRAIDMWNDFLRRSPDALKMPSFPIWSMEFRATYPYVDATPPAL